MFQDGAYISLHLILICLADLKMFPEKLQLPSTESQEQNSESLFNIFLNLCLILNVLPQKYFC